MYTIIQIRHDPIKVTIFRHSRRMSCHVVAVPELDIFYSRQKMTTISFGDLLNSAIDGSHARVNYCALKE